jgi:hypothetical protein
MIFCVLLILFNIGSFSYHYNMSKSMSNDKTPISNECYDITMYMAKVMAEHMTHVMYYTLSLNVITFMCIILYLLYINAPN